MQANGGTGVFEYVHGGKDVRALVQRDAALGPVRLDILIEAGRNLTILFAWRQVRLMAQEDADGLEVRKHGVVIGEEGDELVE